MNIKFNYLKVKGFKHHVDQEVYNFSERTSIVGDNYKGKTTIAEGIAYAVAGTNLFGSNQVDTLINKDSKSMEVILELEVEGEPHEIIRRKASQTSVFLDGGKCTQLDIERLVGSKDTFLSCFWPTYFNTLKDTDARALLISLIKKIKKDEILSQLDDFIQGILAPMELLDTEPMLKDRRTSIKEMEKDKIFIDGQLTELDNAINQPVPEEKNFDGTRLDQLREQLKSLLSGNPILVDINPMIEKHQELRNEFTKLVASKKTPPTQPNVQENCPTCGQKLPGANKETVLRKWREEVLQVNRFNEQIGSKLLEIKTQGEAAKKQLDNAKADNERVTQEWELEQNKKTSAIEFEINKLLSEQAEVHTHNTLRDKVFSDVEAAKTKKEEALADIEFINKDIEKTSLEISAIKLYNAKWAELHLKQVSEHLNRVSIQLFDVVKTTGEVKPVFKVIYDGKEQKVLSTSERIRCGLEISSLMSSLSGCYVPVFIDNAESITEFIEPQGQYFTATVVKGKELEVA